MGGKTSSAARLTAHARAIQLAAKPGAFSSSNSHRDLVKSLRSLATALVASASSDSGPAVPVVAIAQQLASNTILKTSRPDIHLSAALCIVELFKLSAPSVPWHGETLCDVLRLLIKQVALIGDSESSQVMLDQFHILESLAVVKIPVVLLSDGDDDVDEAESKLGVLVDLFQTSMQIAARGLPQQFENCIRDMLSCVLEEADPVPKSLLMPLLTTLVDRSSGAQRSCDLAKRVLFECRGVLESALTEIIADVASVTPSETAKSLGARSRQSELIFELSVLYPNVLRAATHHLQDALESNDEELRLLFVKLLGRVFANAECRVATEFSLLLNAYLKRATDISGRIREEFVTRSALILAQVPEVRIQLTTILTERVLDTCDRVRAALVHAICQIALNSPEVVDFPLLEAIGGRLLDKKGSVRQEAIQGLSSLFKVHCSRYWSESQPVPSSLKKFAWVPARLIGLFSAAFPDRSQSVDLVLDEVVFGRTLDIRARSLLLAAAYTTCNASQKKAFIRHYVTDKRQAASLLNDALSLRDRLRTLSDADHDQIALLTRQRDQRLQSLTSYLPTHIDVKQLQLLFEERDGNVFKWLRFCSDAERNTVEVRAAVAELHGALAASSNKKLQAVADAVAGSVAMVTLGRDVVLPLFDLGSHHANPKIAGGVRDIVIALAEQTPRLFANQLQPITDMISFPATGESEFALRIVALCAGAQIASSPNVETLRKFCCSGSQQQAELSATVLAQVTETDTLLTEAAGSLKEHNPEQLIPLLAASAMISRLQPQHFHDHDQSQGLVQFALDCVQRTPIPGNDATLTRIALRLITDYVVGTELNVTGGISVKDTQPVVSHYRELLLARIWQLLANTSTTLPELVADAFTSILSLMTVPHIEGTMGPHEFAILAGVLLRCTDLDAHRSAVDQLWQRLVVLRLPFRYAALLALGPLPHPQSHSAQLQGGYMAHPRKLLAILAGRLRQATALMPRASSPSQMPEFALANLLHALAAQPEFNETDPIQLRVYSRYIGTFLDAVLSGHHHNFAFLIALLTQLRACVPLSGSNRILRPEPLYALVDVAVALVRRRYQGQQWSTSGEEEHLSRKIPLSRAWFRLLPAPVPGSYLPDGFAVDAPGPSPQATPAKKSSATPRNTPVRKRRKSDQSPATSPPKASRQLPPRRAKKSLQSISSLLNTSDEEEDEHEDVLSYENGSVSVQSPEPKSPVKSSAMRRSPSLSRSPSINRAAPAHVVSESERESGADVASVQLEGEGAQSVTAFSKAAMSHIASETGVDLIDVLMADENSPPTEVAPVPEMPGSVKKAPAALRSTFQLRRSRRRT